MLLATIVVRPQRAELLVQRLVAAEWAQEVTAVECRGYGRQRGGGPADHDGPRGATNYQIEFLPKVVVECLLEDEHRAALIDLACTTCRTGRIGDGKIFIRRIDD